MFFVHHHGNNGPRSIRGPVCLSTTVVAVMLTLGIFVLPERKPAPLAVSAGNSLENQSNRNTKRNHASEPRPWSSLVETVNAEIDPVKQELLLQELSANAAEGDLVVAIRDLERLQQDPAARDLLLRLVRKWAEKDPQAAAEWLNQLPAGRLREDALDTIALAWGVNDLFAALHWARQLPDEDRIRALRLVAGEAVRSHPAEALRVAAVLPADSSRDDLVRRAAMEWASANAQAALQWGRSIQDETLREQVLSGIATTYADSNPESAITLAIEELPEGRIQADTIVQIAQRWAQRQPALVAAWVELFPQGNLKSSLVEEVVSQWSRRDAHQADEWRAAMSLVPDPEECLDTVPKPFQAK